MTIDERIHFFRLLRGMTKKYLGTAVGFPKTSADMCLAQYETGSRKQKAHLIVSLTKVSSQELSDTSTETFKDNLKDM